MLMNKARFFFNGNLTSFVLLFWSKFSVSCAAALSYKIHIKSLRLAIAINTGSWWNLYSKY